MELPVNDDVKHWRIPQVVDWLKENLMDVYIQDFQDHYVDGEVLLRLNYPTLKDMNVHPTHITKILEATKTYRLQNPDDVYEIGSEDDDPDEFDEDTAYSVGGSYVPPDEVEKVSQTLNRRAPPPPAQREEDVDSDESYEVPDDDMAPPPPRPRKNSIDTGGASGHLNNQFHHRPPPPPRGEREQVNTGQAGRGFRPAPLPPDTNDRGGRLQSMPSTEAPLPPASGMTKGKGNRPPAPLPSPTNHISVAPVVPADQSLDAAMDGMEVYEDPDITPDEQSHSPVNNSQHPGMMGTGSKPLPPRPGNSIAGGGFTKPSVGAPRGGQYPLVTLPINNQRKPTPAKVIPSYTDHQLPPTPAPSQPPRPDHTLHTQAAPRLPTPPKPAVDSQPPITTKPTLFNKPAIGKPAGDAVDTSAMSIKERMALLQGQNINPSKPAGPAGKPPTDMMKQMMDVQRERNNMGNGDRGSGKSRSLSPSKPTVVAAPRSRFQANKVESSPPPLPSSSHPSLPSLPGGHNATPAHSKPKPSPLRHGPPTVHVTPHSRQRDSVESTSSQSTDGEQDLYSYTWYKSTMDRSTSMTMLSRRRMEKGAFIVRKSTKDPTKPFTLDVMYEGHDFHISLRKRDDGKFAMGTYQAGEDCWASVADLIAYFMQTNLKLTKKAPDGSTIYKSTTLIN